MTLTVDKILLIIGGVIGVSTLYLNYRQNRYKVILKYLEETQKIREKVYNLKPIDQEKAGSILKESSNLYNVLAYSVLYGVANERDAFNILRRNIFDYKKQCLEAKIDLKQYSYLVKLYNRWFYWGISVYYFNLVFKILFVVFAICLLIFIDVSYF